MIRSFRASLTKDFKVLFRDLASIFLVVVGPLALMLILILAFSNIGFNNIAIGYTSSEGTIYEQFFPKISYIGNFIKYDSLSSCKEDLKTQQVYLCVEPQPSTLNIHFDNTREIISLILLNQIKTAATLEKEALLKQKAKGFLGEVRSAEDFLGDAEHFSETLLDDLKEQRKELVQTKSELETVRLEMERKTSQLRNLRNTIVNLNIETTMAGNIGNARRTLNEMDQLLEAAYVVAINSGDNQLANELNNLRMQETDISNNLYLIESNLGIAVLELNNILREIDFVLEQLDMANALIREKENKINNVINTIDSRSRELKNLKEDISDKRRQLHSVGKKSVEEMVNPLSLSYTPLFTGSERLKAKTSGVELSDKQKTRLLNFGTVQTFLPLIIVLLICFISTILANILLLDEIHSPAFLRNQIIPISWITGFLSKFTTVLSVTVMQSIIILLIGYFVFFLDILRNFFTIFIVLVLLVGTYSIIGMIIAYLVRTKTTSLLVSSFFLIINILLGGMVYPIERMSHFMSYFANLIPFTSGISMLQQSIFYNIPLSSLLSPLLRLAVIFVACLVIFYLSRRYFFYRYAKGA